MHLKNLINKPFFNSTHMIIKDNIKDEIVKPNKLQKGYIFHCFLKK